MNTTREENKAVILFAGLMMACGLFGFALVLFLGPILMAWKGLTLDGWFLGLILSACAGTVGYFTASNEMDEVYGA